MSELVYHYQHLPYYLNPVAVSFGSFRVDWYSLMYLAGFLTVYCLLKYRIKKEKPSQFPEDLILDLLIWIFIGLIVGGRLGYVFFYDFSFFWHNPLAIISPFDPMTHEFIGLYGMSYHGGLIGVIIAATLFSQKRKVDFWQLADFVVPAVPAGYFFGRIGNFINGELYGRITGRAWGMYFPSDFSGLLRHPSQIYEAILEGLVLFAILWNFKNHGRFRGKMLGLYAVGYATFRIIVEFFREPDIQIGYIWGYLTLGQILSFFMLVFGLILIFRGQRSKKMI
jgi:phosphatidylglycerol---prolipoprotein diacylglyceryl transferase